MLDPGGAFSCRVVLNRALRTQPRKSSTWGRGHRMQGITIAGFRSQSWRPMVGSEAIRVLLGDVRGEPLLAVAWRWKKGFIKDPPEQRRA